MNKALGVLFTIRDLLKKVYSKYDIFIIPVLKFLLALIALRGINGMLGYNETLMDTPVVVIVSLLCSIFPKGFIIFACAVFILVHVYALGLPALLVFGIALFVLMLLYVRFTPKDSLGVVLTPLAFGAHLPAAMPIMMGLRGGPGSGIAVACGTVAYYMLRFIEAHADAIKDPGDLPLQDQIVFLVEGIVKNKEMVTIAVLLAIGTVIVWVIHRLQLRYTWGIAIAVGAVYDIIALSVARGRFEDCAITGAAAVGGTIAAAVMAVVLAFFVFNLDYDRIEHVQFEDDDYYYYVKAVPKLTSEDFSDFDGASGYDDYYGEDSTGTYAEYDDTAYYEPDAYGREYDDDASNLR